MQFDNQNNFPPRSITKKLKELPYRDQGSHNIKTRQTNKHYYFTQLDSTFQRNLTFVITNGLIYYCEIQLTNDLTKTELLLGQFSFNRKRNPKKFSKRNEGQGLSLLKKSFRRSNLLLLKDEGYSVDNEEAHLLLVDELHLLEQKTGNQGLSWQIKDIFISTIPLNELPCRQKLENQATLHAIECRKLILSKRHNRGV